MTSLMECQQKSPFLFNYQRCNLFERSKGKTISEKVFHFTWNTACLHRILRAEQTSQKQKIFRYSQKVCYRVKHIPFARNFTSKRKRLVKSNEQTPECAFKVRCGESGFVRVDFYTHIFQHFHNPKYSITLPILFVS